MIHITTLKDEAVRNLYPQVVSVRIGDDFIEAFDVEDNKVSLDDAKISVECGRLQVEHDSQEYQRQRELEYPKIGDQLDDLYHAGKFSVEMTAQLKVIKDKYPKK
jgi:hypothetical protein